MLKAGWGKRQQYAATLNDDIDSNAVESENSNNGESTGEKTPGKLSSLILYLPITYLYIIL